jgi:hypothetical protein
MEILPFFATGGSLRRRRWCTHWRNQCSQLRGRVLRQVRVANERGEGHGGGGSLSVVDVVDLAVAAGDCKSRHTFRRGLVET